MDYDVRLSNSEEIFRFLLTNEYKVEEEKIKMIIEDCKSSLKLEPPSPLYDVIFHKVIRTVLNFYDHADVLRSY